MVFEEAQLYTDGSTITEGSIGDFLGALKQRGLPGPL